VVRTRDSGYRMRIVCRAESSNRVVIAESSDSTLQNTTSAVVDPFGQHARRFGSVIGDTSLQR
jgi:hypothetical protein